MPGAQETILFGFNDRDQAVGDSGFDFSTSRAVLWDRGMVHDLGTLDGDVAADANMINNQGQIVGFSGQSFDDIFTAHALLWENGTLVNLQDTIPAGSDWYLSQSAGLNDRGQITGFGLHHGQIRAFLLTPAGE